ncbi:MAG: N-acetyltransferase family protein [Burkholderiales bacterium]
MNFSDRISLRAVRLEDDAFLFELYVQGAGAKFRALGLPADQLEGLLRMQYRAQQGQYRARFQDGRFALVLADGIPVGQWYTAYRPDEIIVVDVSLLPNIRAGMGRYLVKSLITEAQLMHVSIRAHVEKSNRAWNLWRRLGFRIEGEDDVYFAIEWRPG